MVVCMLLDIWDKTEITVNLEPVQSGHQSNARSAKARSSLLFGADFMEANLSYKPGSSCGILLFLTT